MACAPLWIALSGEERTITQSQGALQGDFLPNLCSVQAVFHLVLVGELLAIALTVAQGGVLDFDWYRLGLVSILIQWIVLTSAACLCPLRGWLRRRPPLVAGGVSYGLVLLITTVFSTLGAQVQLADTGAGFEVATRVRSGAEALNWDQLATNLMLSAVFAGIVLRYFYLQQQLRNQQQAELNARIQALQARIRPHFLFNSMNSIASLIDLDPVAAEKMVVDLSELFRASLSEPGLIPLTGELALCRRFVAIEQVRLGERLQVDWSVRVDESALVPSLLLQPLIENAIYHGIQPLMDGGVVSIRVDCEDGLCRVRVVNPVGDRQQARHKGNGLALDNIRHRLDAHYGRQGWLKVEAGPDTYSVTVQFPASPVTAG